MAHSPVLWQQGGSFPAQADRLLLGALWPAGGVLGGAVTAVANTMTVSAAPGSAAVPLQPGQNTALCHWDAAEPVGPLDPPPPSGQSRVDLIVCQVRDPAIDGGANADFQLVAVKGTPAASNPASPALPLNAFLLARVVVPGGAANLNGATIDSFPTQHLAVPAPLGYDLLAGEDWISTDGASNAYITFRRAMAGAPQTRIAAASSGTQNGVVFSASPSYNTTQMQITAWNGTGGAFGAGAVFKVAWLAIYTVGLAPASLTREEFLQKERQE